MLKYEDFMEPETLKIIAEFLKKYQDKKKVEKVESDEEK